ncbi:MAG: hypothetical protein ABSG91_19945 [Syntrophobacteraceae bacterium]
MKKQVCLLFIGIVFIVSNIGSAQNVRHDGNWWINLQPDSQNYVTIGIKHGVELASILSSSYAYLLSSDKNAKQLVLDSTFKSSEKYIARTTDKEIVDGLNTLYREYNNRHILIDHAIYIVLEGIKGMPNDTYNQTLETIRQMDR